MKMLKSSKIKKGNNVNKTSYSLLVLYQASYNRFLRNIGQIYVDNHSDVTGNVEVGGFLQDVESL